METYRILGVRGGGALSADSQLQSCPQTKVKLTCQMMEPFEGLISENPKDTDFFLCEYKPIKRAPSSPTYVYISNLQYFYYL